MNELLTYFLKTSYTLRGSDISDIIRELSGNAGLKELVIDVVDSIATRSGKPGEATNQNLTSIGGIPKKFEATIRFHKGYMLDASQEGMVAVFIHEILHAYLTKAGAITGVKPDQHQIMAMEYVDPMVGYLQGLFGISKFDAFSLAWSGLTYTGAYRNVSSFEIDGTTYSKSEIVQTAAKYKGRGANGRLLDGRELCDN